MPGGRPVIVPGPYYSFTTQDTTYTMNITKITAISSPLFPQNLSSYVSANDAPINPQLGPSLHFTSHFPL